MDLKFLDSKGHDLQEITQWDINRKVEITGIQPHEIIEVHFYNAVSTRALVVDPVVELEKIIVDIPNILVQQATDLFMAVFVKDGKEGKTEQIYSIPVRKKKKPESYTYEENIDYVSWVELSEKAKKQLAEMQAIIDDVNNKLQSGEFEGNGIKSITKIKTEGLIDTYRIEFTKGQPFEYNVKNGYTPVKGKDYFTEQEKAEMVEETKTKVVTIVEKDSANSIDLSIDSNYLMTANLKNKQGQTISTATIDFPIESMVVNASYSNGKLTLTLQNGNNLEVDISAIVSGLVNETTFNAKVKELNQQIANANQEIDQLTGEVSDIKIQQGTFKQEQTLQNANIGKNTNDIHTLINAISTISPAYDKETAKAEELTITDGTENPAKIEIYGNTKQETTEGYNLIDFKKQIMEWSEAKIKLNKTTMIFTPNPRGNAGIGLDTKPINLSIPAGTDLIFSSEYINGGSEYNGAINIHAELIYEDGTKEYMGLNDYTSGNYKETLFVKKTTTKKVTSYTISGLMYAIKNLTSPISYRIMLMKGTKPKPYEPYTGGQASPNPEFPQEIESVKAYNLFNINSVNNNINCKKVENSIISNISSADYFNWAFKFTPIKIKANEKKYLKFKCKLENGTYNNTFNQITMSAENGKQIRCNPILQYKFSNEFQEFIYSFTSTENLELNSMFAQLFTGLNNASINMKDILISNENKPYQPYGEIAVKQTGKNILDLSHMPTQKDGISVQKIDNNTFIFNGTPQKDYIRFLELPFNNLLEDKQTYTMWQEKYYGNDTTHRGVINIIMLRNKKTNGISYIDGGIKEISFTVNKNEFDYFYIIGIDSIANTGTLVDYKNSYKMYKEKIYPLHLGNIELNKIGEAQDYFHRINGKWHSHKGIGKIILTGEENIKTYGLTAGIAQYSIFIENMVENKTGVEIPKIKCNYFYPVEYDNSWRKNGAISVIINTRSIYMMTNLYTTLETFKQFLKNNNVEVTYELATPTETEITDPVLIEQLNALEKAQTFKGTNILTNNSIAEMKLNYKADTKIYLDNLFLAPEKQAEITQ